jgi:hypothetical protein
MGSLPCYLAFLSLFFLLFCLALLSWRLPGKANLGEAMPRYRSSFNLRKSVSFSVPLLSLGTAWIADNQGAAPLTRT